MATMGKEMMTMTRLVTAFLVAMSVFGADSAWSRSIFEKPMYNEETKSYFELVSIAYYNNGVGVTWGKARHLAELRSFGGVQGRLAVIPSAQVDMFIRINFRPDENTWFGLYYDCSLKNLVWVTGEAFPRNGYANWREPWFRGHQGMFCNVGENKMPVFLAFAHPDHAWAIQLPAKWWYYYLVEYPTGKRLENEKDLRPVSKPFQHLLRRYDQQ